MTEIQNKFWKLNSWNLIFVWNLDFVIWDLTFYIFILSAKSPITGNLNRSPL